MDGERLGGDALLYAQWAPKTYTVTFDGNGGFGGTTSQEFVFDKSEQLTKSTWENIGLYYFLAWADSGGGLYADQAPVMNLCTIDSNNKVTGITLTAQWTEDYTGTRILITNDNRPVSGFKDRELKLCQGDSAYDGFNETPPGSGIYVFTPEAELPYGTYNITLQGYDTTGETVVKDGFAFLSYCTVEIEGDAHANAYLVDASGNRVNKLTRVKRGSTVTIGTNTEEDYFFDHYSAVGVAPSNLSANVANQSIQINGPVLLKAHTVYRHNHRWASAWTGDDTHHWHECEGDCPITDNSEKDAYGAHRYANDADTTCEDCGHVRTVAPPKEDTDPASDIPETGDTRNTGLWLGLALLSLAGFAAAMVKRRKYQK